MRATWVLLLALLLVVLGVLALQLSSESGALEALAPEADAEGLSWSQRGLEDEVGLAPAPSDVSERPATQRDQLTSFTGRAEHWLTDESLPPASFVFRTTDERVEVRSQADGSFEVPLDPLTLVEVEVQAPLGFWTLEHGLEESAQGPLYRARFAPSSIGPFRARLVDEATREPLPEYVVKVCGVEDWSEVVVTDAQGLFQTEVLFPAGPLQLMASEEERGVYAADFSSLAQLEFVPTGAKPPLVTLGIRSGPTFTLIVDKPSELELKQLTAYVIGAAWVEDIDTEVEFGRSLHPGPPVWVRFVQDPKGMRDPQLVLLGPGGRWRGLVAIDGRPGWHADPLHIAVKRMAGLRGRVVDARGEGVPRAKLELSFLDGELPIGHRALSNGRGNFAFETLPTGAYSLTISHQFSGSLTTALHLTEHDEERQRFELEPFVVGGAVSGTVSSVTGEFRGGGTMILRPLPGEDTKVLPRRSQQLEWRREGAVYVAHFEFSAVADARFGLSLSLPRHPFESSPKVHEIQPPALGLEFVVHDDREVFKLNFNAFDDSTKEWLSGVHLKLTGARGEEIYSGLMSGWMSERAFAEDESFTWELSKAGYITERGDHSAFRKGRGRWSHASVSLKRN